MQMVCNGLDIVIRMWIEMVTSLANVTSAIDHVIEMRNNARGNERITIIIKVDAPRVACTMSENFKHMFGGMITPHARIEGLTFFRLATRLAHQRMCENPMATVQPSVRSPNKGVECFVCILISPAIEQNLWFAIGFIITILIGNEH